MNRPPDADRAPGGSIIAPAPPSPRGRAIRTVALFGVAGGLLAAALRYIEYRFLVVEHSVAIYGALVALVFAIVGIRLGLTMTGTREVTVVREVPVPAPAPFVRNEAQVAALGLTPRELEILEQIALGRSTREIASALFVSENTVKTHASRVYGKLGVSRRTQAVQEARRLGLLP
jgi:DNA-binding CsgD family transcriptional regulator